MRFRVAAAVAALALLVILAQSVAMFSLFEEKEEEFIESLVTQQIAHSMEVWASAPEAAYPHTPDMQLFRIAKGDALPAGWPGPIRQLAVGNVAVRQSRSCNDGGIGNFDAVVQQYKDEFVR